MEAKCAADIIEEAKLLTYCSSSELGFYRTQRYQKHQPRVPCAASKNIFLNYIIKTAL